jgi:hypothetical protein
MTQFIGLSGWARSGKDTIADYLVEHHGFTRVAFADPMREALLALNPQIPYYGTTASLATMVRLSGWDELKKYSPETRELLQRMGTEVGRELFGKNFWVNQAIKTAKKYDKVVFSDCRYFNEARAIKHLGGQVWRISRPGVRAANDHGSEHDLDNYNFDLHIDNKTTVENLQKIVDINLKLQWLTKK